MTRGRLCMCAAVMLLVIGGVLSPQSTVRSDESDSMEGVVRVGKVVLGDESVAGSEMDVCFDDGFLTTLARETELPIDREFERTDLADEDVFDYPFIILAGQGSFALSEEEQKHLEGYVRRGGFVLASAGCSNLAWARSFREVADEMLGADALTPLDREHSIFHTVYDIDSIDVRVGEAEQAILAHEVDGIVRLIFSPVGLNATDSAGGGCCCCGGAEVRNARLINTNILAYALTH